MTKFIEKVKLALLRALSYIPGVEPKIGKYDTTTDSKMK